MRCTWHPTGSYDLIVSHFFLDCFFPHQLEQLFDSVLPHALPGAHWVISEFAIPYNPFAARFARGIIRWLYRAFGWTTGLRVRDLPDYAASLLPPRLDAQPGSKLSGRPLVLPAMDATHSHSKMN